MNRKKYVINFLLSMILVFPYICFRINLDTPSGRPIYTEALVKCLPGVGQ